jgi:hypothetical protein
MSTNQEAKLIKATMQGYVAALLESSQNPYPYITEHAWAWQHGYEQGRVHAIRTTVMNPKEPPMPFPGFDKQVSMLSNSALN